MRRRITPMKDMWLLKLVKGCLFVALIPLLSMVAKKFKPNLPYEMWHGALLFVLMLVLAGVFYLVWKKRV